MAGPSHVEKGEASRMCTSRDWPIYHFMSQGGWLGEANGSDPVRKPFRLREGAPLELVVFLDKMVFGTYVNKRRRYDRLIHEADRHADKELALPLPDDLGIALFSEGGTATAKSTNVWEMKPIRLTPHQP